MGEVVDLNGQPARLEDDLDFVSDLARFAEGLLAEKAVKKKHHLSADIWERLGSNEKLIETIEAEKVRRISNGSTKRERAQVLVVQAPNVLGAIMNDPSASSRHRIDSTKILMISPATGRRPCRRRTGSDRINLGSDTLRFDKSIAPDPNDIDPNDTDTTGVIAAIAMNKPGSDGGGEPL